MPYNPKIQKDEEGTAAARRSKNPDLQKDLPSFLQSVAFPEHTAIHSIAGPVARRRVLY
jgi:hypothetical protein